MPLLWEVYLNLISVHIAIVVILLFSHIVVTHCFPLAVPTINLILVVFLIYIKYCQCDFEAQYVDIIDLYLLQYKYHKTLMASIRSIRL
jgi:hypothetical protein